MRVIFSHELMHVLHRDIWFRYLLAIAGVLNFFNPVIWIFSRKFIKYAEYACDYSVCSLENDSLHEYYETIFNMAVKNRNLYDMLTASLYENKSGLRERMEHVTRIYKLKKKSKLVAAGIISLFVIMSSAMVVAAATIVTEISVKVADATAIETEETLIPCKEYYEDVRNSASDVKKIYDADSDGKADYSSNGMISSDVYAGVIKSMSMFYASSGQRIVLNVFSTEPLQSVKAGIIQPDGSMRYIITNGKESHVFALTMDGIYRIYIENNMVDNVHVEGAYSTH